MKGPRPSGVPEHISEENIGSMWQSVCYKCEVFQTFKPPELSDEQIIEKVKQFRRLHKRCDQEGDVTADTYVIDTECEKCGRTSDLGGWMSPKEDPVFFLTICEWCLADTEGFQEFIMEQMEISLEASADYEKTEDGKWRNISK